MSDIAQAERADKPSAPVIEGIARATKGDVTPAGEKFCEILRKISDGATGAKPKPTRSF